jgi:hypothetical protein
MVAANSSPSPGDGFPRKVLRADRVMRGNVGKFVRFPISPTVPSRLCETISTPKRR